MRDEVEKNGKKITSASGQHFMQIIPDVMSTLSLFMAVPLSCDTDTIVACKMLA